MDNLVQSLPGISLICGVILAMMAAIFVPLFIKIRKSRKAAAKMDEEIPVVARKLGLVLHRSQFSEEGVHKYEGVVDGYELEFNSDSESMVEVKLKRPINCRVSTRDLGLRPRQGRDLFDFRDDRLNRLFEIRHASPKASAWLGGAGEGLGELTRFVAQRGDELAFLEIEGDAIAARFKHGFEIAMGLFSRAARARHERSWVRSEDLEELVRVLPRIARELDSASPEDDPLPEDDDSDFDF